jgi:hypothetical protein
LHYEASSLLHYFETQFDDDKGATPEHCIWGGGGAWLGFTADYTNSYQPRSQILVNVIFRIVNYDYFHTLSLRCLFNNMIQIVKIYSAIIYSQTNFIEVISSER